MPFVDPQTGAVHCKITYYGPGMSGKTSSLQHIRGRMPADGRSDMISVATETERTLRFECVPPAAPRHRGQMVGFLLETVPGCVLYERNRAATLLGADGIVFIADSQRDKLQEDIKSLQEMVRTLVRQGRKLADVPIVLQYNKRDIPNAVPVEAMDKYLNPLGWPRVESSLWYRDEDGWSGRSGQGAMEAFELICRMIVERLPPA